MSRFCKDFCPGTNHSHRRDDSRAEADSTTAALIPPRKFIRESAGAQSRLDQLLTNRKAGQIDAVMNAEFVHDAILVAVD